MIFPLFSYKQTQSQKIKFIKAAKDKILMFIAKRKVKRKKKLITYYVLVETVYTKGKPRQKMIKYLGTAEKIYDLFNRNSKKKKRSK